MSRRQRLLGITAAAAFAAAIATWGVVFATASPTYIDLTTAGADVSLNGAQFVEGGTGSGTGQFDPFLTVGSNQDTEQGFNSCPEEMDTSGCSAGRTHALSAAAIPTVVIQGTKYREFSLDANDTGSDDYMSVDEFKLYLDNQSDLHSYNDSTGTFGNDDSSAATKIFDMSPGVILMRSQTLTPGSGVSDITVDVPDSLFPSECFYGATSCNKFVVLFTHMGGAGTIDAGNLCNAGCNYNVTGGFEEWRTQKLPVVNVQKTAVPSLTRTFPWTLKKEVSVDAGKTWVDDTASLNLFNGDNKDVQWRITYTKGTPVDSGQQLKGTVTVTNPTGSAPFTFGVDATVNSVSDVLSQIGASDKDVTLNCGALPVTLTPGQALTCTYSTSLANSNTGVNAATATLSTGSQYAGTASYDPSTATPTVVNGSGTLSDNFDPNLPKTVSGSGSETYTQNQACGSSRTVTNTANLALDTTTLHDPASVNITCYGLTTTKNASPSFARTFDWSVKKYVSLNGVDYVDDSVTLHQFLGDAGTLYWKIVPTRGAAQDAGFGVNGTIVVHNDTPLDANGVSVSDSITGGIAASVDCDPATPGNQTSLNVAANSTGSCSYSAPLPDGTTRTNTATATLFGQGYSGQATIDFSGVTPTTTDATASLDDDLDTSGLPAPVTSGQEVAYTTTADCGSSRTITNTAVLTESDSGTQRTDPASAVVDCQSVTVTKTATPSFTRTWNWQVKKTSQDSALTLQLGQTFFEPYSVTYTASKSDSAFNVAGTITVTSPANAPTRTINSVSDVYAANNATVDCNGGDPGNGLPASISAGGTLSCTYSVDIAGPTNGNNVATATLQNSPSGTHDFTSAPVPVTFGAPTSQIDDSIAVSDTAPAGSVCTGVDTPVAGCTAGSPPSGSITASQAPKTFTYIRIIGPYQSGDCGDHLIDNTASFVTNDTAATGSSSVEIAVHVPCPTGCTLTQGYWKTHSIRGPAPFDVNWNNIPGGSAENTLFFLSGQTWYQVFWTPPSGGNAYYQLAHQYEAALLNILVQPVGADPSAVTGTLASALGLLNAYKPSDIAAMKSNNPIRQQFVQLAGILGSYNEGKIGPGHCSEDRTTSSSP